MDASSQVPFKKSSRAFNVVMPCWNDPRVLISIFFVVLVSYALTFPGFARTPEQYLTVFLTCVLLDSALSSTSRGAFAFPMSGIVTTAGILFLTDSEGTFFYFLNSVVSISSKHFLRIGSRHFFNPNNFGIVFLLLAFPEYVTSAPIRWGGNMLWTGLLLILGVTIAIRANRIVLALSYYLGFFAFALVRSSSTGAPWLNLTTPLFGPGMQLFIFFMITDPKTTPFRWRSQIIFGFAVALIDSIFRHWEIRQAPLFALPLVTLPFALWLHYFPEPGAADPWKYKEVKII